MKSNQFIKLLCTVIYSNTTEVHDNRKRTNYLIWLTVIVCAVTRRKFYTNVYFMDFGGQVRHRKSESSIQESTFCHSFTFSFRKNLTINVNNFMYTKSNEYIYSIYLSNNFNTFFQYFLKISNFILDETQNTDAEFARF